MHTRILRPDRVRPEEVDTRLARGWYRVGQSWMTCRFVHMNGHLRTALWTRLPLEDLTLRKSLRKQLRKLHRDFRVEVGEVVLDDAHQAIYSRYREVARGDRPPEARHLLLGEGNVDRFDTREVRIWDGDRLAAYSWFDVGADSVQSVSGVYDPDYARHSLGFATMLVEIRWAMERDLGFHYAGYVLPGDACMDYKLRVGPMQYLHPDTRRWAPWPPHETLDLPTDRLWTALEHAHEALALRGIEAELTDYRLFELSAYQPRLRNCLAEPAFVRVDPPRKPAVVPLVTWDLDRELYRLVRCVRAVGKAQSTLDPEGEPETLEVWVVADRVLQHTDPGPIADAVARLL